MCPRLCRQNLSPEITILAPGWGGIKKIAPELSAATLRAAKKKPRALTIVLADDKIVKTLNHDFRGKNKPTNVLSFPSGEKDYLGDVILARETIKREAAEQGKTFKHHAMHLIIHGILHLLGYDHESEKEAEKMESLEARILKDFGVKNPYAPRDDRRPPRPASRNARRKK